MKGLKALCVTQGDMEARIEVENVSLHVSAKQDKPVAIAVISLPDVLDRRDAKQRDKTASWIKRSRLSQIVSTSWRSSIRSNRRVLLSWRRRCTNTMSTLVVKARTAPRTTSHTSFENRSFMQAILAPRG